MTTLTKFIRDVFTRNPPSFLPDLELDTLRVNDSLIVSDLASFPLKTHLVGGTGEPAFQNSWVNFGSGWKVATYWKDVFGFVHLAGLIKSGTVGSAAFTLPPGFRPDSAEMFAVSSNNVFGQVEIQADGTVTPMSPSNNTFVSLSGITFHIK